MPDQLTQTQQPSQATPSAQISDQTINAFMTAPQDKQREALGKMSEPTKQALLLGIKAKKGIGTQPPAQIQTGITSQPSVPAQRPPSSTSNPMPQYQGSMSGFTPGHQGSALVQGGKNFLQGITGASPLTPGPGGETHGEGSLIETLANIDKHAPEMGDQSNEIRSQSKEALKRFAKTKSPSDLVEGMTKATLALVPMLGPYLNDKYNQEMSGDVGGALTESAATLATAKLLEHITDINKNTPGAIKDAFNKPVIIATSNKVLDDLRDTQVGKPGVKLAQDNSALGIAIKAKKADIESSVNGLIAKDKLQNPGGATPTSLAVGVIDQAIKDKDAVELSNGGELPKTNAVKKLITENYGPKLTFSNLKDIRSIIGGLMNDASGKDKAVLGDMYSSYTDHMNGLAKQIGGLDEWLDYNKETEKLNNNTRTIAKELKSHGTGLQYANYISKESNAGRLSAFEDDMGLPKDFFKNTIKDFGPIRRFANLAEGGSDVGMKGGRLSAVLRHAPVTLPGMVITAEAMKPFAAGIPYANYAAALYSAVKIDDFMNRFDAARRIREIGGPEGVTGRYGASSTSPSRPTNRPSTGPGGGGSTSPDAANSWFATGSPPSSPVNPSTLSPAIANLLPETAKAASDVKFETDSNGTKWAVSPNGVRISIPKGVSEVEVRDYAERKLAEQAKLQSDIKAKVKPSEVGGREAKGLEAEKATSGNKPFQQAQFDAAIDRSKEIIRDPKSTAEEKQIAASQLKEYREQAAKLEEPKAKSEPKVTKASPEARGRQESVRKGMTKDTPEARRAKAAERVAAKRSEASRTQIKGSLEDQARQVAGRMDFQGKSNIELEEGLQTLYGDNGKRFLKQFQSIAKQQKWSDDVYRGYLEDTIDRRAKELAQRPNVPGLGTEPVQEESTKSSSKMEEVTPEHEEEAPSRITKKGSGVYRGYTIQHEGKDFNVKLKGKAIGTAENFADAQKIVDKHKFNKN